MVKKKNTKIMVGGVGFDTGIRVILWDEPEGLSFYPYKKFHARNWNLKKCRQNLKAFYIHHTVTYRAHSTFAGLNARGLSCVFQIDDDVDPETGCATIYQHLDVKEGAFTQGGIHNHDGAGVEICYYPDGWTKPARYSAFNRKRFGVPDHPIVKDTIHNHTFNKAHGPTEAQVKACERLAAAYCVALPDIPVSIPRDANGKFISTVLPKDQRTGLLNHFHLKRGKMDAMGFPHDEFEKNVQNLVEEMKNSRKSFLDRVFSVLK
jgi:hypothetical protein